jgi:hypothetical protein
MEQAPDTLTSRSARVWGSYESSTVSDGCRGTHENEPMGETKPFH